ncbi:MAG: ABC transporter substrate-binding protein [Alphaproteobacteria bacterium]
MRRYVRLIPFVALLAATPGAANANAMEIFDRVVGFAEDTFKATQRAPDGPPPFRVGLMLPKSGQMREAAARIARGWEIALQMSDGYVAVRPVDLIIGDTGEGPDAAVEAATEMSNDTPIDVFAGVLGARTAGAMAAYTADRGTPLVLAGAIGEGVMSGRCRDNVVRTSFNIGPYQETSGRFIAGKIPTLATLGPDSRGGHRIISRFVRAYRAGGGRIIEQFWAPAKRKYDWSAILSRTALHGPQAVYAFFEGRNAESIVHQHSRNGINKTVNLIGPEWLFDPRVMTKRGKHADGLKFLSSFLPDLDSSENRIFVDAYRKKYSEDPDSYAYMGYENALAVLLTAADLDGQVHDGAAFVETMKKVAYDHLMPRGDFGFNESNSAFLTKLFWVEVDYRDGRTRMKRLGSVPIDPDTTTCKRQTAERAR